MPFHSPIILNPSFMILLEGGLLLKSLFFVSFEELRDAIGTFLSLALEGVAIGSFPLLSFDDPWTVVRRVSCLF